MSKKAPRGWILPSDTGPEDSLFHYTSAAGLLGIVSSGHIRATHHGYLNDESEVEFGFRDVTRSLERVVATELNNPESQLSKLEASGFIFDNSAAAVSDMIRQFIFGPLGGYVFCLCSHNNNSTRLHGLLSQWRGYAEDGGYAIRFHVPKLREYLDAVGEKSEGVTAGLDKVQYGETAEGGLSPRLLARIAEKAVKFLENPSFNRDGIKFDELLHVDDAEEILNYALCRKNDHFSEEQEWRVSAISSRPGVEKYLTRRGDLIPHIELKSTFRIGECIDAVIVGPHANQDARCSAAARMLQANGVDARVFPTGIPLRA